MISDEERRRAAAELREASTGAYRHVDVLDVIAGSIGVDIAGKFYHGAEKETCAALADVVDWPTCRIGYVPGSADRSCSACGATFSTGTYQGGDHEEHEFMFCPNCGAEVSRREPNDEWQPTAEEKGAER